MNYGGCFYRSNYSLINKLIRKIRHNILFYMMQEETSLNYRVLCLFIQAGDGTCSVIAQGRFVRWRRQLHQIHTGFEVKLWSCSKNSLKPYIQISAQIMHSYFNKNVQSELNFLLPQPSVQFWSLSKRPNYKKFIILIPFTQNIIILFFILL